MSMSDRDLDNPAGVPNINGHTYVCMYDPRTAQVKEVVYHGGTHMTLIEMGYRMIQPVTAYSINASYGTEFHYHGPNYTREYNGRFNPMCHVSVGPRGGETHHTLRARYNGMLKTWKTQPGHFRQPVKHGAYASGQTAITHTDAHYWHLASDCPMLRIESAKGK